MNINRVLIIGDDPIANVYTYKLLNNINYVTVMSGNANITKTLRYQYRNKVDENSVKVIDSLNKDDIYDIIICTYNGTKVSKILDMLLNNKSKVIIFSGLRTDIDDVLEKLKGKTVLFAYSELKAINQRGIIKNIIDKSRIYIGTINEELDKTTKDIIEKSFDESGFEIKYRDDIKEYIYSILVVMLPIYFMSFRYNGNTNYITTVSTKIVISAINEGLITLQSSGIHISEDIKELLWTKKKHIFYLYLRYLIKDIRYKKWMKYELKSNFENIKNLNLGIKKLFKTNQFMLNWNKIEKFFK